ncbi:MAG TPA: MBL fold metallo-hydrolase [Dehalococcoidia bacterium]|nr:MBL fold metallo-hydrolase [Dehalococcoidia bacterium]
MAGRRAGIPSWPKEFREVADGVFAYIQAGGPGISNLNISNAGVVLGPETNVAVDALWAPPMTRDFIESIRRASNKPVGHLLLTHHHGDHVYGAAAFRPAEIVSHRRCREVISTMTPPDPGRMRQAGSPYADDFVGLELALPTLTYESEMSLYCGDREVRLLYCGPAHTVDDTLVYLPKEKLLFAGDIAFYYVTPLAFQGHISGWIRAIDRIQGMEVDTVVPGHGPVGGKRELAEVREYLMLVRREARRCYQAGLDEAQAAIEIRLGWFDKWVEPERLVHNVMRFYTELRGDPFAPLDAAKLRAALEVFRAKTGA